MESHAQFTCIWCAITQKASKCNQTNNHRNINAHFKLSKNNKPNVLIHANIYFFIWSLWNILWSYFIPIDCEKTEKYTHIQIIFRGKKSKLETVWNLFCSCLLRFCFLFLQNETILKDCFSAWTMPSGRQCKRRGRCEWELCAFYEPINWLSDTLVAQISHSEKVFCLQKSLI